jgi:hypothetical protein
MTQAGAKCKWQWSIDRIDNQKGHMMDNVRLTCYYCNTRQYNSPPTFEEAGLMKRTKTCKAKCHIANVERCDPRLANIAEKLGRDTKDWMKKTPSLILPQPNIQSANENIVHVTYLLNGKTIDIKIQVSTNDAPACDDSHISCAQLEQQLVDAISDAEGFSRHINRYRPIETKRRIKTGSNRMKQIKINEIPETDEELGKIVSAPDITIFEYGRLLEQDTFTCDEYSKIWRYRLRTLYNWQNTLDLDWCKIYATRATKCIWTNLLEYFCGDSIGQSLEMLQARYANGESVLQVTYLRHMLADVMLKTCGFDNLQDTKMISGGDIEANFIAKKTEIQALQEKYLHCFGNKKHLTSWKVRGILSFVSGMLDQMYGCTITTRASGRANRDKYMIKHKYLGPVFVTSATDNKPYIIPGQQPCVRND